MQTVTNIPQNYRLTRYFAPFYNRYSVKDLPTKVSCDIRLRRVLSIVNEKAGMPPLECTPDNFTMPILTNGTDALKKAFIAFSGGKYCLATAIRAKQDGYEPTLVYIGGVNKSLPSERKHAHEVAKAIGFPLIELQLTINGDKEWHEHPLKNILILCMLIDEGIRHGATAFALGSSFDDDSIYGSLDYDLSDSFDMLKAFAHFVRGHFPQFKFLHYMCNTLQSFYTVQKYNKAIIPLLSTCITPDFRRPMIRKSNISKYGIDVISRDGCGGCYKRADEYLYKQKFGLVRYSPEYFKKCMQAKAQFDRNYRADFSFDRAKYNRYGGRNIADVQVLCDRCGYYIGRLIYDKQEAKWFAYDAYGAKHFTTRAAAEMICERFKRLYHL